MEIICQGLRVCIGIFPILSPRRQIEGGSTVGLITRAVKAKVAAELSDSRGSGYKRD